jgi:NADPH2:quinone reductase
MWAIRQYEFGPPEVLRYEEVASPWPGPGQVRVAVAAAGVHLVDTMIRAGVEGGPFPRPELPMTPGREVAGTVDAVGPGVPAAWSGAPVVAHLGQASGGYAELAVCPAASLHRLPDGPGPAAAVAMIGTGRTAVGIVEHAALAPDDVVLVTAAAGGLGTLLVQAGRDVGATVVALAGGPAKVELARQLGATFAVDYRAEGWPQRVRQALGGEATVLLDGVGGRVAQEAAALLGRGGRIVAFGWSSGQPLSLDEDSLARRELISSSPLGPAMLARPGGLRGLEERALSALAAGELVPVVGQRFRLADAALAHHAVAGRGTTGKTVLVP